MEECYKNCFHECCKNCFNFDYKRVVCTYYSYDEFEVDEDGECQISNSIGCFEPRF